MEIINWVTITLLSAIFFGLKDILAKKFFNKNITPLQLIFEEYLLLFLIVVIIFPYHVDFSSYKNYYFLYALKAISVGGATLIYFKLLKKHDISIVSPMLNLSPLILLFLSSILLGESITKLQLFGIMLIIFFTYFLEITITHHHKTNPHKHHFLNLKSILKDKNARFFMQSFIMVFLISLAAITDKMILENVNEYTNLYFTSTIILIVLLIYYIKEKHILQTFENIVKEPETMLIAIMIVISNFLILKAISIPAAMVSLIIPLRRTSTLFSSIIGGILFHEKHLKKKIIAALGMFIGVIIIVI